MSVLNIYIDDFIGIDPSTGTKGVTLQSVVGQVSAFKSDYETIKVNIIDSPGGDGEMGIQIYDYLLSTGKNIHTHAVGLVASASSYIYMSGHKRTMDANARLVIHNPFFENVGAADADYLEVLAKDIRALENKYEKTYSKASGVSENAISDLMKNETYITAEEAISMGFATEKESAQLKAVAFFNTNNNEMKKEEKESLLKKMATALGVTKEAPKVLALDVNTTDGGVLVFEREEGQPEVGDRATYEGEEAEGAYSVAEGTLSYVFVGGELTEIEGIEAQASLTEADIATIIEKALMPMQAKLSSLQEENTSLKTEQTQNTKMLASIKGIVSESVVDTEVKKTPSGEPTKQKTNNQFF